jgi:hypothetical protein
VARSGVPNLAVHASRHLGCLAHDPKCDQRIQQLSLDNEVVELVNTEIDDIVLAALDRAYTQRPGKVLLDVAGSTFTVSVKWRDRRFGAPSHFRSDVQGRRRPQAQSFLGRRSSRDGYHGWRVA